MKHAKAVVSLMVVAGGLALAAPAQAVIVTRHIHVFYHAAAKPAAASTDVVRALDCGSGAFTADGTDLASADVTAVSDGAGGCKITASIEDGVKNFVAVFTDSSNATHKYVHAFVKDDAMKNSIDVLER